MNAMNENKKQMYGTRAQVCFDCDKTLPSKNQCKYFSISWVWIDIVWKCCAQIYMNWKFSEWKWERENIPYKKSDEHDHTLGTHKFVMIYTHCESIVCWYKTNVWIKWPTYKFSRKIVSINEANTTISLKQIINLEYIQIHTVIRIANLYGFNYS